MLLQTLVFVSDQKLRRPLPEHFKESWSGHSKERNSLETIHTAESFWRNYALKGNKTWEKTSSWKRFLRD
jgi:hypothetical protein